MRYGLTRKGRSSFMLKLRRRRKSVFTFLPPSITVMPLNDWRGEEWKLRVIPFNSGYTTRALRCVHT